MLSKKVFILNFYETPAYRHRIEDIQLVIELLLRRAVGYPMKIRPRKRKFTFKREKKDASLY